MERNMTIITPNPFLLSIVIRIAKNLFMVLSPCVIYKLDFLRKSITENLLRSNLKYAITGSDDSCDAYSLEKQILKLEEESEHLMELMGSTSGDTDRFLNEIKNNFEQVKILREKLQIAKISAESDLTINSELERLEKMFTDTDVSFNEYDDVIVRRLIECNRVVKGSKVTVVLKGGSQIEEALS